MNDISQKRTVIEIFQRALDQSAFVLKENPELTFPQIYNRAQWKKEKNELLKNKLQTEEKKFQKPWFKILTRSTESPALIRTFTGHYDFIRSCVFNNDGNRILSTGEDSQIILWDTETGEIISILEKLYHRNKALCEFSPDGKSLISTSGEYNLKLRNSNNGSVIRTLKGHTKTTESYITMSCSFSPDGKYIASVSTGNTIWIWDVKTGKLLLAIKDISDNIIIRNNFSPEGSQFVSGSKDNTLIHWDIKTGKRLKTYIGHKEEIYNCIFSPDGKRIISASADKILKLWDTETGKELATLKGHSDNVINCSFSPDGKIFVSASTDNTIILWDTEDGKEIRTLKGHTKEVCSCKFIADGNRIISKGADNTIKVWDVETGELLNTLNINLGYTVSPNTLNINLGYTVSPSGEHIIVENGDETLKIWNIENGEMVTTLRGHAEFVNCYSYSTDGRYIISGSGDNTLKLWDMNYAIDNKYQEGHTNKVNDCEFSPNGKKIVSASADNTLKLWDTETGKELATLKGHSDNVTNCSFSPDGKKIVSASADNTLKIWDAEDGIQLRTLKDHRDSVYALSRFGRKILSYLTSFEITTLEGNIESINPSLFSPDGRYIVTHGNDNTIRIWDFLDSREIIRYGNRYEGRKKVFKFSPDGWHIASVERGTGNIWEIKTGENIAGFHHMFYALCDISPDGKFLISSGGDRSINLSNIKTGKDIKEFHDQILWIGKCSFSPDGNFLITASDKYWAKKFHPARLTQNSADSMKIWNIKTGIDNITFKGHFGRVTVCKFSPNGRQIVMADRSGQVLIISIENFRISTPVITAVRLLRFKSIGIFNRAIRRFRQYWDENITAVCNWCGKCFPVSDKILDLIRSINRNAGITPDLSPCLHLPDEAWEEPKLVSECPLCHKPIKFNPFVVDNRDSRDIIKMDIEKKRIVRPDKKSIKLIKPKKGFNKFKRLQKFIISNPYGLDARTTAKICHILTNIEANCYLEYKDNKINLKEALDLLTLAITQSEIINIICDGPLDKDIKTLLAPLIDDGLLTPVDE